MTNSPVIAFIGAGNMARSLIGGLVADGYDPNCIWATNPSPDKLADIHQQFAVQTSTDNAEAASKSQIVVFCLKPAILKEVAQSLPSAVFQHNPLVITIAAGVREVDLRHWLGTEGLAIVRCMPNTPALLRCGASALFANPSTSAKQKDLAESILRTVGLTLWVDQESMIDTVTALSGSGPAYFFYIIEALQQAAVKLGLPEKTAQLLTLQTALGAARMALESEQDVAQLRKLVTSPGGTTEAAVSVLDENKVHDLFFEVVRAAELRAKELSNRLSDPS